MTFFIENFLLSCDSFGGSGDQFFVVVVVVVFCF